LARGGNDAAIVGFVVDWLGCALLAATYTFSQIAKKLYERRARMWRAVTEGKLPPPKPGYSVVHGKVETEGDGPAVTIEIGQYPKEWEGRRKHIDWIEDRRVVRARPFYVLQANGERIRVEPDDRVFLVDKLEPGEQTPGRRTLRAKLEQGEPVHVLGLRVRGTDPMTGGYRESGEAWIIRPPKRGRMLISTEPLDARDERRASYHAGFGTASLVLFLLLHVSVWRFHYLRFADRLRGFNMDDNTWTVGVAACMGLVIAGMAVLYLFGAFSDDEWYDRRRIRYTEGWGDPFRDAEREREKERHED
jgi:hypothetical protein